MNNKLIKVGYNFSNTFLYGIIVTLLIAMFLYKRIEINEDYISFFYPTRLINRALKVQIDEIKDVKFRYNAYAGDLKTFKIQTNKSYFRIGISISGEIKTSQILQFFKDRRIPIDIGSSSKKHRYFK